MQGDTWRGLLDSAKIVVGWGIDLGRENEGLEKERKENESLEAKGFYQEKKV